MNQNEKITSLALMNAIGEEQRIILPVNEEGTVSLVVKKNLSISEAMEFIENIVISCVDDELMEYTPESYGTVIRKEVLSKYANVEMPVETEDMYKLVWNYGLYERVCEHINMNQLNDLLYAANERINFEKHSLISSAARKVTDLLEQLGKVMDAFGGVFDGLDRDGMNKLMLNLSEMEKINTADVVKVITDQKPSGKTVKKKLPKKVADQPDD